MCLNRFASVGEAAACLNTTCLKVARPLSSGMLARARALSLRRVGGRGSMSGAACAWLTWHHIVVGPALARKRDDEHRPRRWFNGSQLTYLAAPVPAHSALSVRQSGARRPRMCARDHPEGADEAHFVTPCMFAVAVSECLPFDVFGRESRNLPRSPANEIVSSPLISLPTTP